MCGRYVVISSLEKIEKRFALNKTKEVNFEANVNLALGDYAPVISNEDPKQLQFFQFGFSPSWVEKQSYLINARSEGDFNKENDPNYKGTKGILQKPMFKQAIRQQRCLVIADAFIEGPEKEKLNKPYVVYSKTQNNPFAMAGIWSTWYDQKNDKNIYNFAIVTTPSNPLLEKIGHHRAPLILSQEHEQVWLDKDAKLSDISALMQSFDSSEYNAYPISSAIKSAKNKDPQLLQPIAERLVPEFNYEIYKELVVRGMGQTRSRIKRQNEEGTQGLLF